MMAHVDDISTLTNKGTIPQKSPVHNRDPTYPRGSMGLQSAL
jgi:hypothetical protein